MVPRDVRVCIICICMSWEGDSWHGHLGKYMNTYMYLTIHKVNQTSFTDGLVYAEHDGRKKKEYSYLLYVKNRHGTRTNKEEKEKCLFCDKPATLSFVVPK